MLHQVGLLAGAKLGGLTAVGGSILGYTGASVIKEQKEMRAHIDEYYTADPELYTLTPREEAKLQRRHSERTPPLTPGLSPRRRASERLLPQTSPGGSPVRRKQLERTPETARRILAEQEFRTEPHLRRTSRYGPRGYRAVPGGGESRSANSSPVARRRMVLQGSSPAARRRLRDVRQSSVEEDTMREVQARRRPPNLCYNRQFRRLGDLSEQEQRSVVALICNKVGGRQEDSGV